MKEPEEKDADAGLTGKMTEKMTGFIGRLVNRETILYLVFGVLTTLVDWLVYPVMRHFGHTVAVSQSAAWAAAVLFAFVTNKSLVFQSYSIRPSVVIREFISFAACRAFSGALTVAGMVVLVDFLHANEWLSKALVSAVSLVLNYVFSKWFIFRKK